MNKLELKIEKKLEAEIFSDLKRGRPDWDLPHTKAVVFYIKEIIKYSPSIKIDQTVLIIAAYAHDWGYAHYFNTNKPLTYDQINEAKRHHMDTGSKKIFKLLDCSDFDFLSDSQKNRIVHLVKIHDNLRNIHDSDERILVEADTLGGLDINKIKPTFNKASNDKYLAEVKTLREPLFITDYGKLKLKELFKLRKDHYLNII
jgi:hypothetical protein